MAYRSILAIWDGKDSSRPALDKAIELTKQSAGHLHVICTVFATVKTSAGYPFAEIPVDVSEAEHAKLTDKLSRLKAEAENLVNTEDIFSSVETAVLNRDEVNVLMDHAARFSDLVVLPQPYGTERGEGDERLTEATLLADHCPILIIPPKQAVTLRSNAIIGWDGSKQALRAAKMAIPLLHMSDQVDVVIVAKDVEKKLEEQVYSDIATFLARHRMNVEVKVIPKSGETIADLLLDQARQSGASLIVMGGYGHSPIREFLFGGATRKMLEECQVPVFMAH